MAVDGVQGTALDDGIVTAARELAAAPATSRRVLVVLTDGKDTSSAASAADARTAVTKAQVAVYPIALHSSDYAPAPLRALASASGGTFRDARSGGLTDVYASIADELARTYVLDYSSGASERVVVQVTADGLTARTALRRRRRRVQAGEHRARAGHGHGLAVVGGRARRHRVRARHRGRAARLPAAADAAADAGASPPTPSSRSGAPRRRRRRRARAAAHAARADDGADASASSRSGRG